MKLTKDRVQSIDEDFVYLSKELEKCSVNGHEYVELKVAILAQTVEKLMSLVGYALRKIVEEGEGKGERNDKA